jgi:hypothetical protein
VTPFNLDTFRFLDVLFNIFGCAGKRAIDVQERDRLDGRGKTVVRTWFSSRSTTQVLTYGVPSPLKTPPEALDQ